MVLKTTNTNSTKRSVKPIIGKQYSLLERLKLSHTGSGSYYLRFLKSKKQSANDLPKEGSRCNFERFTDGVLLRINDNQELFEMPLSLNSVLEMKLIKGFEKLQTNPVTDALFLFGIPENEIEKYWGFLNKRKAYPMHLLIRTREEVLWLEANGFSYYNELEFWEESGLFSKIEIHA